MFDGQIVVSGSAQMTLPKTHFKGVQQKQLIKLELVLILMLSLKEK